MKEPSIMKMDWKALGYERQYKDGRLRWIPQTLKEVQQDEDPSA
jgi:hypothetical protein